jgi:hypothetical protein
MFLLQGWQLIHRGLYRECISLMEKILMVAKKEKMHA